MKDGVFFRKIKSERNFSVRVEPSMKMNLETKEAGLCLIAALAIGGCKPQTETPATGARGDVTQSSQANRIQAEAALNPTQGHDVKGKVTFSQGIEGVRVVADLTGLEAGEHGFHIHEKGDCSAPDASSAGGHFNPTSMPHGGPDSAKHHVGDLGNINADASGKAHLDRVFSFLQLTGTNSIVGHALIVHAGKDDLTSQPSGNAAARVACGVIEKK